MQVLLCDNENHYDKNFINREFHKKILQMAAKNEVLEFF